MDATKTLSEETIERVREALPDGWSVDRERDDALRIHRRLHGALFARVFTVDDEDTTEIKRARFVERVVAVANAWDAARD